MKMKQLSLRLCYPLLLTALLFVTACGGEESQEPLPTQAAEMPVSQAEEALATETPIAARGGQAPEEAPGAGASRAPAAAQETADIDGYAVLFQVQPDGFGFRNYGAGFPEGNFTIAELHARFGDGVCSRIDGGKCIPTAEAQQWLDDRNADMIAGHCIGFTVATYRFLQEDLQPASFNADVPFDIEQEAPIMRTIAADGSLYWVHSVWSSEVSGSPRDIIDALLALREPVDLSIFLPGLAGGHSLLAYGVEQVAPHQFHILVYDNNFPGEEAFVEVDYEANTWRYDRGAANPDVASTTYAGDAATETLRFIPLQAYETAVCPFCPAEGEVEADRGATILSFVGKGDALVETERGAVGSVDGQTINEIPGARLLPARGQLSGVDMADIILPADAGAYTVNFYGMERVSSMRPGFSIVLDQLSPGPEINLLQVVPVGQSIHFQAGGAQSPAVRFSTRQGDASYNLSLFGFDLAGGQGFSLGMADNGEWLEISGLETGLADATLLVTRLTAAGESIFAAGTFDVAQGQRVALDIADWDGGGSMRLLSDANGDGRFDVLATEMANEPLDAILHQGGAAEAAIIFGDLGPYLSDQDLALLLAALPDLNLPGEAIGEILQPLQLGDEQLVALIPTFPLPESQTADLIFNLRLEPERQEAVVNGLDLPAAESAALQNDLDNLALYHDIEADWTFLNSDDPSNLTALLGTYDLDDEQAAALLPHMDLNTAESEWVLNELGLEAAALDGDSEEQARAGETAAIDEAVNAVDLLSTPEYQSAAFCTGDDLQIVALEPTWKDVELNLLADEGPLLSTAVGAEGAAVLRTVAGPGTWTNLRIEATVEPFEVPLGTISCP